MAERALRVAGRRTASEEDVLHKNRTNVKHNKIQILSQRRKLTQLWSGRTKKSIESDRIRACTCT